MYRPSNASTTFPLPFQIAYFHAMFGLNRHLAVFLSLLLLVSSTGLPVMAHLCDCFDVASQCEPETCCDESDPINDAEDCCANVLIIKTIAPQTAPAVTVDAPSLPTLSVESVLKSCVPVFESTDDRVCFPLASSYSQRSCTLPALGSFRI